MHIQHLLVVTTVLTLSFASQPARAEGWAGKLLGVASALKTDTLEELHDGAQLLHLAPRDVDPLLDGSCPFVAHNSYGQDGLRDKLESALDAGLRGFEVDESWDGASGRAVVTHDALPAGFLLPELGGYLNRIFDRVQADPGRGFTLVLDLKSGGASLVHRIQSILVEHRALLSSLDAAGQYHEGKLTVYLSGNRTGMGEYGAWAPAHGGYLAFGDGSQNSSTWQADPTAYVPSHPAGWQRYLNLSIVHLTADGQRSSTDRLSADRIQRLTAAAAANGYAVRIWVVNAVHGDSTDFKAWDACIKGGVKLIATDDYGHAADHWRDLAKH